LIDCGLFQGIKPLRELNWQPLSVWLPLLISSYTWAFRSLRLVARLVDQGFKGKIYCSGPTKKLQIIHSGKIQEEEAERANKEKYSKHEVAEPLYNVEQAKVFPHFK
jgi:metallo-beta-lactamase family protein